jgi:DNA-binding protein HU-beta
VVFPALYSPFLSTLVWADSAGQPDFLLHDGAEKVIMPTKKAYHRCFIALKIGLLGYANQKKSIKTGISVLFSCIIFVFNISLTYIYPRIHFLFNINKLIMNKGDLIEAIAKGSDLTKADAGRALDATLDAITKTLKKGDKVTIPGFGTFSLTKRAARTGRNPATGEAIKIKAKKTPKFKAGSALSEAVK